MDGRSMNSLEVSPKSPLLLDGTLTSSAGQPTPGTEGSFRSLLAAAAGDSAAVAAPSDPAGADTSGNVPLPTTGSSEGEALPEGGKGGNILPVRAPAVAATDLAHASVNSILPGAIASSPKTARQHDAAAEPRDSESATEDSSLEPDSTTALVLAGVAPSIAPLVSARAEQTEVTRRAGPTLASLPLPDAATQGDASGARSALPTEAPKPQTGDVPASRAIAVQFADLPQEAAHEAAGASPAKAGRTLEAGRADASVHLLDAPAAALSTVPPYTGFTTPAHGSGAVAVGSAVVAGAASDAAQDLARIVDRLAAAREALAPAAAALAIKHSEFGELSLRFDQQRDGHLAVHIAASNAEAQRAIIAAASQQPSAGASDNRSGGGEQFSQAQAREGTGGRGGAGHGGPDSQAQAQQRRPAPQAGRTARNPGRHGVFA
jgi:hypothetical protein